MALPVVVVEVEDGIVVEPSPPRAHPPSEAVGSDSTLTLGPHTRIVEL
jgi:hypothetical protein